MRSGERRQNWRGFAIMTVAGVLLSVALQDASLGGWIAPAPLCNSTAPSCNGTCPLGESCETITRGNATECVCRALGCCLLANDSCLPSVTALECLVAGTKWVEDGTCAVDCAPPTPTPTETPTSTPTATATATATSTGIPNGGSCVDPADCMSGNCEDDVCCDTACDGPQESCNLPGNEGVCTAFAAAAPAASHGGLLLLVAALGIVAALTLWRRPVR